MIVTTYHDVNDFLLKTEATLEANEAANNLMLGLCFLMRRRPERIKHRPYLVTVEDGVGVALAGVMMPPRELVLYSERPKPNLKEACREVARDLIANEWGVPGLIGPTQPARVFAEIWAEQTGRPFRAGMSQRIYELRHVIPPVGVPGRLRPAALTDLELVTEWAVGFTEEAVGQAERAEVESSIRRRLADGDLFLWEDVRPVSMAAKARAMTRGIVVNLVYTPPEQRGRGYASACVAALSQRLLDSGWQFCALFTDLANATSNKIYQQIGYVPLTDFQQYKF